MDAYALGYKEITQRIEMMIRRYKASGDRYHQQYAFGAYLAWQTLTGECRRDEDSIRLERIIFDAEEG